MNQLPFQCHLMLQTLPNLKLLVITNLKLWMRKAAFEQALEQGHNISECELSIIYGAG